MKGESYYFEPLFINYISQEPDSNGTSSCSRLSLKSRSLVLGSILYDAQIHNLKEFNPLAWLLCPNMSNLWFPFWREKVYIPQSTPSPPLLDTTFKSKRVTNEKNFRLHIKVGEVDKTFHPAGEWSLYKEYSLFTQLSRPRHWVMESWAVWQNLWRAISRANKCLSVIATVMIWTE